MKPINKNRTIFLVLLFLLIVNLSALVAFFAFNRQPQIVACSAENIQCGDAFGCELGLSEEQVKKVDVINAEYQLKSGPIAHKIREIRSDILDELSAEMPDTVYISEKSAELCDIQLALQRINFTQFLELKKVCDPEQAQRLSALYRELYGCSRMDSKGGRMTRHKAGQK